MSESKDTLYQKTGNHSLAIQSLGDINIQGDINIVQSQEVELNNEQIIHFSRLIYSSFKPTDISDKFDTLTEAVNSELNKLKKIKRNIVKFNQESKEEQSNIFITQLLAENEKHSVILASGGTGKTFCLNLLYEELLEQFENRIPIFISLRGFQCIKEINEYLGDFSSNLSLQLLAENPQVVFLLDGVSEYADQKHSNALEERAKLFSIISSSDIIATSRYNTAFDESFSIWELQPLEKECVLEFLNNINNSDSDLKNANFTPPEDMIDLLLSPLHLLLYILLQGEKNSKSELLLGLYQHLTFKFKESQKLLDVLSRTAVNFAINGFNLKWILFKEEFERLCVLEKVEHLGFLENCGLFQDKRDYVLPIHDIYWDWLIGYGILNNWHEYKNQIVHNLALREKITLALKENTVPEVNFINEHLNVDIEFVALFVPLLKEKILAHEKLLRRFTQKVNAYLVSDSDYKRYHGVRAAIISKRISLIQECLHTVLDLASKKFSFAEAQNYLTSGFIRENIVRLKDWVYNQNDNKSVYFVKNVIYKANDRSWSSWAEKEYLSGQIDFDTAFKIYLANNKSLPSWIEEKLLFHLKERGLYNIKPALYAGPNLQLAEWVLNNYETLIKDCKDSGWLDLNSVIVKANSDTLFEKIVSNFYSFSAKAQEFLCFAIDKKGGDWLFRIQKSIDLSKTSDTVRDMLLRIVPDNAEDNLIDGWIKSSDIKVQDHGWKSYAKKNQLSACDKIISNLPSHFGGLHLIPTLRALKYIDGIPTVIIEEITKRLRSPMQPMAFDDIILVFNKIRPHGILHFYRIFLSPDPTRHQQFFVNRFLDLYSEWESTSGSKIYMEERIGDTILSHSFSDWLVLKNLQGQHIFDYDLLRSLRHLKSSQAKDKASDILVLRSSEMIKLLPGSGLPFFNIKVFSLLMTTVSPSVTFKSYQTCLSEFDSNSLEKLTTAIVNEGDRKMLMNFVYQLSIKPIIEHLNAHKILFVSVMERSLDFQELSSIANLLQSHSILDILDWVKEMGYSKTDSQSLFLQQVGRLQKMLLLNEEQDIILA